LLQVEVSEGVAIAPIGEEKLPDNKEIEIAPKHGISGIPSNNSDSPLDTHRPLRTAGTDISEESLNRLVSLAEIATWNGQ